MDISPNSYKSLGEVLQLYSENLIKELKENNQKYDYAIDLGSGLGNITQLLYNYLKIKTIYGIDIDQNMVEFARSRTADKNIRFVVQDMATDWQNLDQDIKGLERKVGLIYSSFVLDLIADRKPIAKNVYRLLAPGGEFTAIVVVQNDQFNAISPAIKVPEPEQQLELWTDTLKFAGLTIEQAYFSGVPGILTEKQFAESFASIAPKAYEMYITETDVKKRKDILEKIKDKVINDSDKYTDESTGAKMVRFDQGVFIIKAIK